MFGLIGLWLLLSATRGFPKELESIRAVLPSWFVLANLGLAPFLLAGVGLRVWPIPLIIRLLLLVLGLCSYSIASLAYREHSIAFIAMLAILFLEACWIVPKWNERHRHDNAEQA